MLKSLNKLFSPKITVCWKGKFRNNPDGWYPSTIKDRELLKQFMQEAGLSTGNGVQFTMGDYDKVLEVASKYGYCLESKGYE